MLLIKVWDSFCMGIGMILERQSNLLKGDGQRLKKHSISAASLACSCLPVFCRVIWALKYDLVLLAQLPKSLNSLFGSPLTATLTVLSRAFTKHLLFQLTVS